MKGNVLVLGNSGVGKSTLINAVLGTDVAAAKSQVLEKRGIGSDICKLLTNNIILSEDLGFPPKYSPNV